jgi:hypothetical protein
MSRGPLTLRSIALRPTALAAVLMISGLAVPARADLVVTVQSVAVDAGSTNDALDVTLTNTGTGSVDIGGFSFGLSTSLPITFTSATISTTLAPYIFAGDSLFGPIISTVPPPSGQSLMASDNYDIALSGITLASGATVGLGHVIFDAGLGIYPVAVNLMDFPFTSLSDLSGADVPITRLVNGTISLRGNSVPEPSTLALTVLGVALVAGLSRSRRQKAMVTPEA